MRYLNLHHIQWGSSSQTENSASVFFSIRHKVTTHLSFNDTIVIRDWLLLKLSCYFVWIKLQIMTNMNTLVLSSSVLVIHHQPLFTASDREKNLTSCWICPSWLCLWEFDVNNPTSSYLCKTICLNFLPSSFYYYYFFLIFVDSWFYAE